MFIKFLNLCLLSILSIAPVYAEEPALVVYDLKIFDYQLGMTYDEANSVRAFHYTVYPEENSMIGVINSAYIEDVEFNVTVHFMDDRVFKIIGRFDPKHLEEVTTSLKNVLGAGEDNSKTINTAKGTVVIQSLYKWSYPGARIDLVSLSNNAEFATLCMMAVNSADTDQQP